MVRNEGIKRRVDVLEAESRYPEMLVDHDAKTFPGPDVRQANRSILRSRTQATPTLRIAEA